MTKTFLTILLAATAAPVFAEPPAAVSSIVQTADLDLSTAKGQGVLDRRLAQAVKNVCGKASPADLRGQNDVRRCRAATLSSLTEERDQRIAAASARPIEVAAR